MKRLEVFSLDITYECNFRCRHCFNSSGEQGRRKEELSDEQIIEIFDVVKEYNPDTICICGGETLLRKDLLLQLGRNMKGTNIAYNLVSNGYLIDEDTAMELKKVGYHLVQISLDGFEENHEWLRNKVGAYQKAVNAIKLLKKVGLNVAVSCAPSKKNIGELAMLIEYCNELGVDYFRMQPMMSLGRAQNIDEKLLLVNNKEELLQIIYAAREKMMQNGSGMKIEWGDPIEHLFAIATDTMSLGSMSISAYGEIFVSPYLPIVIGNLKMHTLDEYLEANILENYNNNFIRKTAASVRNERELDINKINKKFPKIFCNNNIYIDYLDKDYLKISKEMERIFWGGINNDN